MNLKAFSHPLVVVKWVLVNAKENYTNNFHCDNFYLLTIHRHIKTQMH